MKSLARTRAIGGSLVVTIPKEIVKEKTIREGELIRIEIKKIQRDGFGIAKGVGPFTKEDELDTEL